MLNVDQSNSFHIFLLYLVGLVCSSEFVHVNQSIQSAVHSDRNGNSCPRGVPKVTYNGSDYSRYRKHHQRQNLLEMQ